MSNVSLSTAVFGVTETLSTVGVALSTVTEEDAIQSTIGIRYTCRTRYILTGDTVLGLRVSVAPLPSVFPEPSNQS